MIAHVEGSSADAAEGGRVRLASLMRKFLYISGIAIIIALAVYAFSARLSPQYRAETTILIEAANSGSERIGAGQEALGQTPGVVGPEVVEAQLQLLRSHDLARTVTQSLGLDRRTAFVSALRDGSLVSDFLGRLGLWRNPSEIAPEERVLETFSNRLSVAVDDGGMVIRVAFTSADPRLAADVANAVAAEYVALQQAAARDRGEAATRWLEEEIGKIRRRIAAIDGKIKAYRGGIERLAAVSPEVTDLARQQRAEAQLRASLRDLEAEAAEQRVLLDSYVRRHGEALAGRQSGVPPVDARILSEAPAPVEPSFPQKGAITALVGALALIIMIAFVVVRRLARGRQPQAMAEVPLPEVADSRRVAVEGRWSDDRGVRRIMPAVPTFADIDAGRHLGDAVAATARRLIGEGARRIMVVTACAPVGKSRPLVAVALARALARAERRPVLIDLNDDGADSLSMGEGIDLPGFSDLFAGAASFGQVIFRDRKSRVHFIPAGLRALGRQDLGDDRIGLLVNALDDTYDHVVFDVSGDITKAIGAECDAAVVATEFDEDDPRTALAAARVRALSSARIVVFKVDPEVGEVPVHDERAADGEAA